MDLQSAIKHRLLLRLRYYNGMQLHMYFCQRMEADPRVSIRYTIA
jgi:hypothetical protein